MPTLTRYILFLAVAATLGLAAIVALATLVTPPQREITISVPKERLAP
ncbi:hypothetical protein [Ensifer soli]